MDIVERLNGPIADAVHRLCRGSWRRDGEVLEDKDRPKFSIPASYERDSDLIATQGVKDAMDEITRLRARLAEAKAVIKPFAEFNGFETDRLFYIRLEDVRGHLEAAARWMEGKADATDELRKAKADAWDEAMNAAKDAAENHHGKLMSGSVNSVAQAGWNMASTSIAIAIFSFVNPYGSKTDANETNS